MPGNVSFTGSVPANYDKYLGPYLFEPYALDVIQRLANDNCKQLLEIACGTGRVTNHLVTLLPADGRLVATDLNADMIAVASSIVKDKRVEWKVADAQELPFNNDQFDHVICQYGVMFFPDKPKAFGETFRVLKPGGKFIFATWDSIDKNPAYFIQQLIEEIYKDAAPDFFTSGPYSFYDRNVIEKMLQDAGFKSIKIEEVAKTTDFGGAKNFVNGFVDGTPLSGFMDLQPEGTRERFKQQVLDRLAGMQQPPYTSMQAFVCEGIK